MQSIFNHNHCFSTNLNMNTIFWTATAKLLLCKFKTHVLYKKQKEKKKEKVKKNMRYQNAALSLQLLLHNHDSFCTNFTPGVSALPSLPHTKHSPPFSA